LDIKKMVSGVKGPPKRTAGGPPVGRVGLPTRKDIVPERKFSFEIPPDPIPPNNIKKTINTDVLVVGGGISGICTALSAAEAGARVILIEKTKSCLAFGGHNAAIGSRLQKKLGIEIDREEVILNLMKYAGNRPDQRLIRMWAYGSGETMDWVMNMTDAAGIEVTIDQYPPPAAFNNANEYYPQYFATHDFWKNELLMECLVDNALKKGVVMHFKTRAKQLIRKEKGRVMGVIAQNDKGDYLQFNTKKAVVLCTGDYGYNSEMVAKYCPQVGELQTVRWMATGDGHQMAMWIGAEMEPAPHAAMIHPTPPPLGNCAFLQVNIKGERYQNEDVPCEYYCTAVSRQPGKMSWQIFDSKYMEELKCMGIGHLKINKATDETREFVENRSEIANTIEELAEKIGVPIKTFVSTVTRYNELAGMGKDLDFGKRADRLTTIDHPPYYAGKGGMIFICAMGGLNVNARLQPLDKNYEAIPGLYLGGNITGNRYGFDYPSMMPGLSNGMALYFGRIAGLNAATLET
jgi:fumarate reductase flavoprotein subunit